MSYISFKNYTKVRQSVMNRLRLWIDNGLLTPEQALPLIDEIYDVELVGEYQIFNNVRAELDEGRYI